MREISRTGDVGAMRVLKGDPMLDEAALDAVRQWKYEPVSDCRRTRARPDDGDRHVLARPA